MYSKTVWATRCFGLLAVDILTVSSFLTLRIYTPIFEVDQIAGLRYVLKNFECEKSLMWSTISDWIYEKQIIKGWMIKLFWQCKKWVFFNEIIVICLSWMLAHNVAEYSAALFPPSTASVIQRWVLLPRKEHQLRLYLGELPGKQNTSNKCIWDSEVRELMQMPRLPPREKKRK